MFSSFMTMKLAGSSCMQWSNETFVSTFWWFSQDENLSIHSQPCSGWEEGGSKKVSCSFSLTLSDFWFCSFFNTTISHAWYQSQIIIFFNKHIIDTVTCFFPSYAQSSVLPVMVFFYFIGLVSGNLANSQTGL